VAPTFSAASSARGNQPPKQRALAQGTLPLAAIPLFHLHLKPTGAIGNRLRNFFPTIHVTFLFLKATQEPDNYIRLEGYKPEAIRLNRRNNDHNTEHFQLLPDSHSG
jgi:hypothetical protein